MEYEKNDVLKISPSINTSTCKQCNNAEVVRVVWVENVESSIYPYVVVPSDGCPEHSDMEIEDLEEHDYKLRIGSDRIEKMFEVKLDDFWNGLSNY